MTNEEAIKFLKQLYPYGGHCWLDGQRTEAIGMAIKALQEEPANDSFEAEVKKLWKEINTGHNYSIIDSYNIFYGLCMDIADWQKTRDQEITETAIHHAYHNGKLEMKEQLMANAIDGFVIDDTEEGNGDFLLSVDYLPKDMGLKDKQKVKVIVIKED